MSSVSVARDDSSEGTEALKHNDLNYTKSSKHRKVNPIPLSKNFRIIFGLEVRANLSVKLWYYSKEYQSENQGTKAYSL